MQRLTSVIFLVCLTFFSSHALAVTLKIATASPDGTIWMEKMHQAADEIKRRTKGRVIFRFYPGGIMGNDASVMRKINVNQLQGGIIPGGGLKNIYPDSQIYSLPLIFRSYDEVDYVRSQMDDLIIKGLEQNGFISFGLSEGGFAYLMADKPVARADDLKGQKIWIPEGDYISRSAFETVGVSPISLPLTDVLTALQTGLINTVAASPMGAIALQWHSRIKYVTDEPLAYLYGTMIVKAKAFTKLKAEDQHIVREVIGVVYKELNSINRNDNTEALKVLRNQGIQFVATDKQDQNSWREMLEATEAKMGQEGKLSHSIIDTLKKHLRDFRQKQTSFP
ncbi:MAG: TRAP transporter substrate-binding protein [Gammaproteobacteria bacterium]